MSGLLPVVEDAAEDKGLDVAFGLIANCRRPTLDFDLPRSPQDCPRPDVVAPHTSSRLRSRAARDRLLFHL